MRVRTAHVEVRRATGVDEVFERAVDRRLAWIFGTGHIYKDLVRVSKAAGYRFWVPETPGDDEVTFWIAVREDLILENSWTEVDTFVTFAATREGFGNVVLGDSIDHPFQDEKALIFFIEDGRQLEADDKDFRIANDPTFALNDTHEYVYEEHVYAVRPLS